MLDSPQTRHAQACQPAQVAPALEPTPFMPASVRPSARFASCTLTWWLSRPSVSFFLVRRVVAFYLHTFCAAGLFLSLLSFSLSLSLSLSLSFFLFLRRLCQ